MRPRIARRGFLEAAGAIMVGSWLSLAVPAVGADGLRAGAAVADITPALGVSLSGPISKRGPARRIVTPLHSRALVLDDGRDRIAFVVCDCTIIHRDIVDKAKRLVRERTGLPHARLVLASTHSHAAPRVGLATSELDLQYYDLFRRGIADAVSTAIENLTPAKVGWGVGIKPEFVRCRRHLLEPGTLASTWPTGSGVICRRRSSTSWAATRHFDIEWERNPNEPIETHVRLIAFFEQVAGRLVAL